MSNLQKDQLGKDASILKEKKLWLFDLDGTIYNENILFDGALELLELIEINCGKYVFITNNSSKSLEEYICKVNSLGIPAIKDNFFTSIQATVLYLKKNFPNAKVYCQSTKSMINELLESNINVTENADENVDVVLVGFDTELTTEKIRKTCYLVQKGIPFIATNCDLRCPVSFGFIPDCGSICQMITNATGKAPYFIGKPSSLIVNFVMEKFGYNKKDTVVIGDRLYTDIATGNNANVTSVCVLSGETKICDIKNNSIKPSFVFESVKNIAEIMKK